MIPYSIAVVFPTVWKIEAVQKKAEKSKADREGDSKGAEVDEVRGLLTKWNAQHAIRGLMPLVGAFIGVKALADELKG